MDNLLVFDNKGRYMAEVMGEIYNMNIIKALRSSTNPDEWIPRYVTCVYSKESLPNEANITRFEHDDFIKDYIKLYQEIYELDADFPLLLQDYNLKIDSKDPYSKTLMNAYYTTMQYNQSLYLDIYKKRCTVKRETLDIEKFNNRISINVPTHPTRIINTDQDLHHKSYVIYFEDGVIPEWYGKIEYDGISHILRFDKLVEGTSLERFTFLNRNNTLEMLKSKIT